MDGACHLVSLRVKANTPREHVLTALIVSFTGALYVIVFALIGLTTVHPLAPILLSSFALSTNAITFIASIPVLVGNDALLGTAFGVWKAFVSVQCPDFKT